MAHSNIGSVENATRMVLAVNPRSVLDIGVGFGLYGFMCRMWLDARRDEKWAGVNATTWSRRLVGIEGHAPYTRAPHVRALYDEVLNERAVVALRRLASEEQRFDLGILSHVLEHMPKDEGDEVLSIARKICGNVIVGLPLDCSKETDPYDFDNTEFGGHISDWSADIELLRKEAVFSTIEENEHALIWIRGETYEDTSVPGWVNRWR